MQEQSVMKSFVCLVLVVASLFVASAKESSIVWPLDNDNTDELTSRPRVYNTTLEGDGCVAGTYDFWTDENLFNVSFSGYGVAVTGTLPPPPPPVKGRIIRMLVPPKKNDTHLKDVLPTSSCNLVITTKVKGSTCKAWLSLNVSGTADLQSGVIGSQNISVIALGSDAEEQFSTFDLTTSVDKLYLNSLDACFLTSNSQRDPFDDKLVFKIATTLFVDNTADPTSSGTATVGSLTGAISTSKESCDPCGSPADMRPAAPPLQIVTDAFDRPKGLPRLTKQRT